MLFEIPIIVLLTTVSHSAGCAASTDVVQALNQIVLVSDDEDTCKVVGRKENEI